MSSVSLKICWLADEHSEFLPKSVDVQRQPLFTPVVCRPVTDHHQPLPRVFGDSLQEGYFHSISGL